MISNNLTSRKMSIGSGPLRSIVRNSFYDKYLHINMEEGGYQPARKLLVPAAQDASASAAQSAQDAPASGRYKLALQMFVDVLNLLYMCARKNMVHRNVTLDQIQYIQRDDATQFFLGGHDLVTRCSIGIGEPCEGDDVFTERYDITYAAEGYIFLHDEKYYIATDAFTDLWSLGICFWEMLTGKRFRDLIRKYMTCDKKSVDAKIMSKIYRLSDIKKKMISMVEKLDLKDASPVRDIIESIFCRRGAGIDLIIPAAYAAIGNGGRLSVCVSPLCIDDRAASLMSVTSSCTSECSMPDVLPDVLPTFPVDHKSMVMTQDQKKAKDKIIDLIFTKCASTFSQLRAYDFDTMLTEIVCKFDHPIAAAFALCAMISDIVEGYYFDYESVQELARRVDSDTTEEQFASAAHAIIDSGIIARLLE